MDLNTSEGFNPVQLSDGRTVWLQLTTDVGELLYKGARLHEKESRLAPTTRSDNEKEVRRAIRLRVALEKAGFWESPSRSRWREALQNDPSAGGYKAADFWEAVRLGRLEARFKQHQLSYNEWSVEDKAKWLYLAVGKSKAERDAQAFFEYSGPKGLPKRPKDIKDAELDIRAAELKDALDFSWPEIGKALGIPREAKHRKKSEEYYEIKGTSKHASDAGGRGRGLLMQVLSEEEYRAHIQTVKPDLERWYSLSQDEQLTESALDGLGIQCQHTLSKKERESMEATIAQLFEN